MTPPKFWHQQPGLLAGLLAPAGWVYDRVTQKRLSRQSHRANLPVICVGNVNMGGVGKTPTVIEILLHLQSNGHKPVVLMRGYGGENKGPIIANDLDARAVGDEAVLLSSFAPVIVSQDRVKGAQMASDFGDLIIMDDGFQNPSLAKDVSVLVVDCDIGFGNGRVFPAGPLREKVKNAFARADITLGIGGDQSIDVIENSKPAAMPFFRTHFEPVEMGIDWSMGRFYAFAGIGRPEKFFNTLKGLGAELIETRSFSDHQQIPVKLLQRMEADATKQGARLITTEKDAARLPKPWQGRIMSLPMRLKFEDQIFFENIDTLLAKRSHQKNYEDNE